MYRQLLYMIGLVAGYVLMFWLCEFLNKRCNVGSEYTRKLAHVISLLVALTFPFLFEDAVYVYLLTGAAAIVLIVAGRRKKLLSIHGVERRSEGSYLLAIGVAIAFFIYTRLGSIVTYILPLLVLAVCDTLANVVGTRVASMKLINGKTLAGSAAFFISAFLISALSLYLAGYGSLILLSFSIAFFSALVEMLSLRGADNLTIPLVVISVLVIFDKIA